jgi:type III secretion protein Q
VRLVFELGRLGMPLAEVAALGSGHAFDLGRSQQTLVDIVAAGLRIGTGSLMKVADGIGVRVNQIAR